MLADAFCGADDRVREAQSTFDGTQTERARMLAAFAVTVGSDTAVADLLGLTEREVRLARRTVGKDVARSLAASMLTLPKPGKADSGPEAQSSSGEGVSRFTSAAGPAPVRPVSEQSPGPLPRVEGVSSQLSAPEAVQEWSPALDSFLVDGWNRGVDASTLAARLGVGLSQLISRTQSLFAEGRLTPVRRDGGRHRRPASERMATQSTPANDRVPQAPSADSWSASFDGTGTSGQSGTPYAQYQVLYGQDSNGWAADSTDSLPRHDWDGILHDWNRTHSAEH
ncbi:hypothetical protein ACIOEW_13650 [Streptomyces sp. NPDC087901]|uniref:hypothetical protein n=1 Tax=unclassified Streptomyces TaxID=2593676 RepID=UPI003444EBB8